MFAPSKMVGALVFDPPKGIYEPFLPERHVQKGQTRGGSPLWHPSSLKVWLGSPYTIT
jgi:hypothetical protein